LGPEDSVEEWKIKYEGLLKETENEKKELIEELNKKFKDELEHHKKKLTEFQQKIDDTKNQSNEFELKHMKEEQELDSKKQQLLKKK